MVEIGGILPTRVFESLVGRVKNLIADPARISSNLPGITCAASLAHHKLLGFVNNIWLLNVDLTSVPDEHLASLVSGVETNINIENISDCGLVSILDSVRSEWLSISNPNNQSLDSEETRALVRAMESRVEKVRICDGVTLDIKEMIEYHGLGKCKYIRFNRDCAYKEQLMTWATSRNWVVRADNSFVFSIQRRRRRKRRR